MGVSGGRELDRDVADRLSRTGIGTEGARMIQAAEQRQFRLSIRGLMIAVTPGILALIPVGSETLVVVPNRSLPQMLKEGKLILLRVP
jgi:hypothetical protein